MESVQVEVKIELGHKASCKETLTPEGYTHDWVVFVRGPESCDISHFVDKVVFHLHESFAKPKRVLKDPPYQVAEAGYGSFFLAIEVYFKSKEEPRKLKFDYDLFLPLYGAPPIDNIRSEALTFKNLTDEFKRKLIKGGGIVTSINAVNGQHSSKKQAAKTNKKRRAQEDVSGSSSEEDTLSAVDISSSSEEDTLSAVDISYLSSLSDTGYNAERGYLDSTKKQAAKTNKKRRAQEDVSDWLSSGLLTPSLEERLRDPEHWIEDKFLGSGAYGEVYMYTHCYTREVLAVKKVNIQPLYAERDANVKGLKELRNEIAILKRLRHERIVTYHQSVEKEKHLYLYMDYMTGGSLRDKIKSQRHGVLSEDLSRTYTKQILEGVCYLHSQQIVHRDIKGDNVLLDDNGDVKLADFGLARKFEKIGSKTNLVSHVGTPYWMAPEVILGKPYGRKADNWSVGCTVVEMMTGRPPLGHMEPLAAMFRVGSQTFEPESVKGASLVANKFIRVALTWDAKDRPQSHELLKHPFICGSTVTREDHEKRASSDTLSREDEEKQTSTGFVTHF